MVKEATCVTTATRMGTLQETAPVHQEEEMTAEALMGGASSAMRKATKRSTVLKEGVTEVGEVAGHVLQEDAATREAAKTQDLQQGVSLGSTPAQEVAAETEGRSQRKAVLTRKTATRVTSTRKDRSIRGRNQPTTLRLKPIQLPRKWQRQCEEIQEMGSN